LKHAKQRLAGLLTPEERLGLAQAMLADTLRAVRSVQLAEKIFVATNYEPAIRTAQENGWEILREESQISESASVDWASRICAQQNVTGLLRLPLDLPLVQSADLDELLAVECAPPAVVMVPSRDGTGTNAILRMPPALFPSHFGEGSLAKHLAEAETVGARVIIRRNTRLEMDVDDESDLRALLQNDLSETQTGRWLAQSGVAERFTAASRL
jgi:2-phospho-L-lactate/phosphoenolpyruvate guanylyltransferase